MKLLALGCALLASTSLALAQPTTPPPPQGPPAPQDPNAPPGDQAPQPNPDTPPPVDPTPATPPPPAPATPPPPAPATPPPPAPAPPDDKKTATERRLAAAVACAARAPTCDWIMTFSSLEKLSIQRSLANLGLEIEPAPWDKVIGQIRIYNEDVFAERNWLRFFNHFHITTRESTIRGELTVSEGEVWDDKKVAESARRLKDPLYTGVVALLPVKSAEPGKVDLLVVTRDIWSLRLNTKYTVQQGSLTDLSISLSENNFLGRRKTLALGITVDQGSVTVGPLFIDKNFLGEHLDLRVRIDRIFTRQSLDIVHIDPDTRDVMRVPSGDPGGLQDDGVFRPEGSQAVITLTKTLWSLASKWGGGGSFSYRDAVARSYLSTGIRAVDNPATPMLDFLPLQYRSRGWNVRGSATRQWGDEYKHQFEFGYSVNSSTPDFVSNFPSDPTVRAFFRANVMPREELVSSPFIEYSFFRADFHTVRNVDTFELAEDLRLGPNASVGLQQSVEVLGSDTTFTRPSATAGWTFPWGRDGFVRLSAGGQIRMQAGTRNPVATIDNTATGQVRAATPTLGYLRVIAQSHFETRWNDRQNAFYYLGSESGLRGYDLGQFSGDRRFVSQLEARSVPVPFWVLRLGAVAFYEVGGAASSFGQMALHHDVGVGFRMLIPQTARDLFRFDFARPLDGQHRCPIPGNICFIAGFDSYF